MKVKKLNIRVLFKSYYQPKDKVSCIRLAKASIFLKYCTDNPRHRFYHALAYQTSARPSELLQLKIGDIEVLTDENGKLCALVDVGRYGKKKQSRIVGITEFAIQYLQPYLSSKQHPDPTNRKACLFVSRSNFRCCSSKKTQDWR